MKRIISLLLVIAILGSAIIFCSAESKIEMGARLEYDDQGNVNLVFSIPEGSNLSEFNLHVLYPVLALEIDYESSVSFESNLDFEEEELMEWSVLTDRNRTIGNEKPLYPHCIIEGYYKGEDGLSMGGDLFTLKFTVNDCSCNDQYNFEIEVNYLLSSNGESYDEYTVPEYVNFELYDYSVVSYNTTYQKYTPTKEDLSLVNDQSKLAVTSVSGKDYYESGSFAQQGVIGNYINGATNLNTGNIACQMFVPQGDYIQGVKVYMNVDTSVNTGTPQMWVQMKPPANIAENGNTITPGSKWGGSIQVAAGSIGYYHLNFDYQESNQYNKLNDVAILTAGSTYVFKLCWVNPQNCYQGYYWYQTSSSGYTNCVYLSGAGDASNYTKYSTACMKYRIVYDADIQTWVDTMNSLPTTITDINNTTLNTAQSYYDNKITSTQKSRLSTRSKDLAYQNKLISLLDQLGALQSECDTFIAKVNAIATGGITLSDASAISAADTAYAALGGSNQKSHVADYKTLLEKYRTSYNTLVSEYKAVITSISGLSNPVKWAERSTVSSIRTAYNALTSEQQGYVSNYSTLTAAEARISAMETAYKNAISKISAIGTVDYTDACSSNIAAARSAYNAVSSTYNETALNNMVSNYSTLTAAESTYKKLVSQVTSFNTAVNAIGTVTLSDESAIVACESTYSTFTSGQKNKASSAYSTLTSKRTALNTLKSNVKAYQDAVDAIFTNNKLYNSNTSNDKISAANTAWTNLGTVGQAESVVSSYRTRHVDANSANEVRKQIAAIGTVTYTNNCNSLISTAETAYTNLNATAKGYVPNYSTLTTARSTYDQLEDEVDEYIAAVNAIFNSSGKVHSGSGTKLSTADTKYAALTDAGQISAVASYRTKHVNAQSAYNVYCDITDIGTVTYTSTCSSLISTAESSYSALNSTAKGYVSNYSTLTTARSTYDQLEDEVEAYIAAVNAIFNSSGKVDANSASKLTAADTAYAALTDAGQISAVASYRTKHVNAQSAYNVYSDIDDIGTVAYTSASKSLINTARSSYNSINSTAQGYVSNYSTLTAAEASYARLDAYATAVNNIISDGKVSTGESSKFTTASSKYSALINDTERNAISTYKAAYDEALDAYNTAVLIDGIGTVSLDSYDAITAARNAYNALNSTEQGYIEDDYLPVLESAEESYARLLAYKNAVDDIVSDGKVYESESSKFTTAVTKYNALINDTERNAVSSYKTTYDNAKAAYDVVVLINDIGTVQYTSESKALIDAARAAYNNLNDTAKGYVSNLSVLTAAEDSYARLDAYAKAVDAIVDGGKVYADEGDEITYAASLYSALNDTEKNAVSSYKTTYDNAEDAYEVVLLFEAIGTVDYTDECKEKIDAARNGYDALNEIAASYVPDYDILLDAEERYAQLVQEVEDFNDLVATIGDVTLSDEQTILQCESTYDGFTDGQKDKASEMYGVLEAARVELNRQLALVAAVKDEISSIDPVALTSEKIETIINARSMYENLEDDEQRDAVSNYNDLVNAEDDIAALLDAEIEKIGTVDLDDITLITNCENYYASLTDTLKGKVNNYSVLVAARERYEEMLLEIAAVEALIDALPSPADLDSEADANYALEQYNNLTDLQKAEVSNKADLDTAFDEIAAAWQKVHNAEDVIDAMFEPTNASDRANRIATAKSTYNALTDPQKNEVSNYNLIAVADQMAAIDDMIIAFINAGGEDGYKVTNTNYSALSEQYDAIVNAINNFNAENPSTPYTYFASDETSINYILNDISLVGQMNSGSYAGAATPGIDLNLDGVTETSASITGDSQASILYNIDASISSSVQSGGFLTAIDIVDDTLPANTKFVIKDVATEKIYGYESDAEISQINLDNFTELETGESFTGAYDNAQTLSGDLTGLSFVMIFDFSKASISYTKAFTTRLSIFDRDEFEDATKSDYSVIYQNNLAIINISPARSFGMSNHQLSTATIEKQGNLTVTGNFTVGDIADGYTDTMNPGKLTALKVQLKDSTDTIVPFPVGAEIKDATGVTIPTTNNNGIGYDYFVLDGVSADTSASVDYTFTIDFANCIEVVSGNYYIVIALSRVNNSGYPDGYLEDNIQVLNTSGDLGFTIADNSNFSLNPDFVSMNGEKNKIIKRNNKNSPLVLDVSYVNSPNFADEGNETTLTITLQKMTALNTFEDLTIANYISGELSKTLSQGSGTLDDLTLTVNGSVFEADMPYRLVFTMTNGDTMIERYIYLVTSK